MEYVLRNADGSSSCLNMDLEQYIAEVRARLNASAIVSTVEVVDARVFIGVLESELQLTEMD